MSDLVTMDTKRAHGEVINERTHTHARARLSSHILSSQSHSHKGFSPSQVAMLTHTHTYTHICRRLATAEVPPVFQARNLRHYTLEAKIDADPPQSALENSAPLKTS